jgi:hypothetical protein
MLGFGEKLDDNDEDDNNNNNNTNDSILYLLTCQFNSPKANYNVGTRKKNKYQHTRQ